MIALSSVTPADWARAWTAARAANPLVYTITNFVAAPLQANITLAAGGRPLMSRNIHEAGELAARAPVLVVNTGTPDSEGDGAIRRAMERSPMILLDPVGYGASSYRRAMVDGLLRDFHVSVIKGNWAEVCLLAGMEVPADGVDAPGGNSACDVPKAVRTLAERTDALVCATGARDYVSDGRSVLSFSGGSALMATISGGGCALGSLMATLAAGSGSVVAGCTAAIIALRLAAERAEARSAGPGTFQAALVDELYVLSGRDFLLNENQAWVRGEGL